MINSIPIPFYITILTLYPEMFPGPLGFSLAQKAREKNIWNLKTVQLRDYAQDRHRTVDDTPAGGGPGMILKADVLSRAIDAIYNPDKDTRPILLLSPRGQPLTQQLVHSFSKLSGLILICGRFEGVDQRLLEKRPVQEISVGDYILSGGEIASMALLDSVIRLLPGVMGNKDSANHESFENFLLEHPHYTRPLCFEGSSIPPILLSGNHKKIEIWRRQHAEDLTRKRRPDLWKRYKKTLF